MTSMDQSLLISKYVQTILDESEEIKAIIGNDSHKIFPLLQPDNLTFPFIVHSRSSLSVTYTKDLEFGQFGWTNNIQYTVACVSNDYVQCIELVNAVRHTIEGYRWKTQDMYIHPIKVLSAIEYTTEDNAFVEELILSIDID